MAARSSKYPYFATPARVVVYALRPARFPVYVSAAATTADVHLQVTGDASAKHRVDWTVGGAPPAQLCLDGQPVAPAGSADVFGGTPGSFRGRATKSILPVLKR
ncbi:MAG: hypothetical protein U0X20_05340 [Caldilineaceae bacterium]